jgi:hypothetical protein
MLVGLNFDLDSGRSESGQIYHQTLNPSSTFFQSASDTVKLMNPAIEPTNIFMITYDAVLTYDDYAYDATYKATFQIFLLTNSSSSYVIFQYTSCLNGESLLAPSGLIYYYAGIWQQDEITNPCSSSNVNSIGIWVFDTLGNY